jgi:transposase
VKAYVKRNKNDTVDAAAICEAVTRPSKRFVPVKSVDQQAVLMMRRAGNLLVRQRAMAINALRALKILIRTLGATTYDARGKPPPKPSPDTRQKRAPHISKTPVMSLANGGRL